MTSRHRKSNDKVERVGEGRDWRRLHHSPVFWIGIALCLAAILIYVGSNDLSWRPRSP